MANKPLPTLERVRQLLSYDPLTGELRWKFTRGKCGAIAGELAGSLNRYGYIRISVDYHRILGHRLAWFIMTGAWPKDQIDHINGVRNDNRWVNLREATGAQNDQNRKKVATNTSGYPGVSLHQRGNRWKAQIGLGRRIKHLGCFATPEEAYQAYLTAKAELHTFCPTVRAS